jgi:hypothetical protein
MKESKKSAWWKSLTPEEQEDPKNVKKLFHRPFFQRRREDRQMEKALAYARGQLELFDSTINAIEQIIEDNPKVFEGMTYRQRKRLIGYLITEDVEEMETEEIFAEQGEEGMMNKDTIEEMKEEEGA